VTTIEYFNVAGTGASLIGLAIVLYQIKLVKDATRAAKEASEKTRSKITELLFVMDLPKAQKIVLEIQNFNRQGKLEISLLRMQDLKYYLLQIKNNTDFSDIISKEKYTDFVTDLSLEIKNIEKEINSKTNSINIVNLNTKLEKINTQLSDLDSTVKTEGGKNAI
jgi:hypothetical protein